MHFSALGIKAQEFKVSLGSKTKQTNGLNQTKKPN